MLEALYRLSDEMLLKKLQGVGYVSLI